MYFPDAKGRVCRQNDVLVGQPTIEHHHNQEHGEVLDWVCPSTTDLAPTPRVRHTMTFLTSFSDESCTALVSIYFVYGGRSSPDRGMHDAWLLCVVMTPRGRDAGTNVNTFLKAVQRGDATVSNSRVHARISWIPLCDPFVMWQPTSNRSDRLLLGERNYPLGLIAAMTTSVLIWS